MKPTAVNLPKCDINGKLTFERHMSCFYYIIWFVQKLLKELKDCLIRPV